MTPRQEKEAALAEALRPTESEKIFADKMKKYLWLGFTTVVAEQLADSRNADFHTAKTRLLDRGCTHVLAARILL